MITGTCGRDAEMVHAVVQGVEEDNTAVHATPAMEPPRQIETSVCMTTPCTRRFTICSAFIQDCIFLRQQS